MIAEKKMRRWYPHPSEECVWRTKYEGSGLIIVKVKKLRSKSFERHIQKRIFLNNEGTDVWRLCDGQRKVEDIITEIINRYSGNRKMIAKDITNAISMLSRKGYLTLETVENPSNYYLDILKYPKRKENVIWNLQEDILIMMNTDNSEVFTFPKEAKKPWILCDGDKNMKEIIFNVSKASKRNKLLFENFLFYLKLFEKLELIDVLTSPQKIRLRDAT